MFAPCLSTNFFFLLLFAVENRWATYLSFSMSHNMIKPLLELKGVSFHSLQSGKAYYLSLIRDLYSRHNRQGDGGDRWWWWVVVKGIGGDWKWWWVLAGDMWWMRVWDMMTLGLLSVLQIFSFIFYILGGESIAAHSWIPLLAFSMNVM